jgi:hypothetical protein
MEAALLGYPDRGAFAPAGDADLRQAIYAPEAGYAETAASAIAALFPEDLDPILAKRLADRAFPASPRCIETDGDLIVVDTSSGPSASSADIEAAFLAGTLAAASHDRGPICLIADGRGPEGPALAEAVAASRNLSLVLLYPSGSPIVGIEGRNLAREGGTTRLVWVRGGEEEIDGLVRACAGSEIGARTLAAAGPANPARFASRIIGLASIFAELRKGFAGDMLLGIAFGSGLDLAAALWSWKLGLPLTGIILPVDERSDARLDGLGMGLVNRFDYDCPGGLRSLALLRSVDDEAALSSRATFLSKSGLALGISSAKAFLAAEGALEAGLGGHSRMIVPCVSRAGWDEGPGSSALASGGLPASRPDAEIGASLAELASALTA